MASSPIESKPKRGRRRGLGSIAVAVLLSVASAEALSAAAPTEYQLKAAFLFNFAKFIEWPDTAFRSPQSPLSICVVGDDPFGRDLDEIVRGQAVGERSIAVKRTAHAARDDYCHIVFVSSGDTDKSQRGIAALKGSPSLTVIEHDDVVDNIVINLLVEDRKLRFGVNMDAADRAGLRISSKLLRLAKTVRERRKD
jgi:hypothetical protein